MIAHSTPEVSASLPDPRFAGTVMLCGKPQLSLSETVRRVAVDRTTGIVRLLFAPGGWIRTVAVQFNGAAVDIAVDLLDQERPGLTLQNATIDGRPVAAFARGCLRAAA